MRRAVLSWVLLLVTVLVAGPGAASLIGDLRGTDGGLHTTPLTSATPAHGLAMGLAGLAAALLVGVISARLMGVKSGLTMAGLVVAWMAYRTGQPDELLRRTQDTGILVRMAIEGAIVGVVGIVMALVVMKFGHGADMPGSHVEKHATRGQTDNHKLGLLAGVAAGVVVGGVLAVVIGFETLKLQALAAAIFAGVGAGVAAQLAGTAFAPTMSGRRVVLGAFLAMAVLASIGPVSAFAASGGSTGVMKTAYNGSFFGLSGLVSLDWLAGALLGTPIGLGWAGSMIDKRSH